MQTIFRSSKKEEHSRLLEGMFHLLEAVETVLDDDSRVEPITIQTDQRGNQRLKVTLNKDSHDSENIIWDGVVKKSKL